MVWSAVSTDRDSEKCSARVEQSTNTSGLACARPQQVHPSELRTGLATAGPHQSCCVLQKIRDFDGPTPSEFARALDALKREQASFDFQQPYAHAAYFSRLATYIPEYPVEELRAATKRVTLEQVRNFSALLRAKEQSFFGQALIIGNLSVEAAKGILETFDVLPFKGALKGGTAEGLLRSRFAKLQPGQDGR
eukprot:g33766.t1